MHSWVSNQHLTIRFWQVTFFPKAYFDVNEDHTGIIEETGNERVLLHIYLDDAREEEWHDLKPNGFTESRQVNDFPIRDRRRWLTAET